MTAEKSDLIDWEQLDMMADGFTPDFVQIYLEFIGQMPELLDLLGQFIAADNVGSVRDVAHKIKGSAANFGFVGVSAPMAGVESKAKEFGSIEGAADALALARENFGKSCEEIRAKQGVGPE